jgi:atlastin
VVGAFRTGKSFLLDLFLHYLRWCEEHPEDDNGDASWLTSSTILEGNIHSSAPSYSLISPGSNESSSSGSEKASLKRSGFKWRGGRERMTTGIWFWSRPFYKYVVDSTSESKKKTKVAVLLMDTQGMFDSETSQLLTTCIFGLSTLLCSYQIYNLVKQVQEDNLQHLALFTEYGKRVLEIQKKQQSIPSNESSSTTEKPFQHLELVIRDAVLSQTAMNDYANYKQEMASYLNSILSKSANKDIVSIRQHIQTCFSSVGVTLLPHPGYEVAENETYDGSIHVIRDKFIFLVNKYIQQTFHSRVQIKRINGRIVINTEYLQFAKAYCKIFQLKDGFPDVKILLQATADANNRNALEKAYQMYSTSLEKQYEGGYLSQEELQSVHEKLLKKAMLEYDGIATFGDATEIAVTKDALQQHIDAQFKTISKHNRDRNPWVVLKPYILALLSLLILYFLRGLIDLTCSSWLGICKQISSFLSFLISLIFLSMVYFAYSQRAVLQKYLKFLTPLLKTVFPEYQDRFQEPPLPSPTVSVGGPRNEEIEEDEYSSPEVIDSVPDSMNSHNRGLRKRAVN